MKKLIYHNPWNNLSMAEKAEMIGVAVRNGITSLPEIKAKYNEFAEGGRADIIYQHTEPDASLYADGGYMEKAKAMIRANEGWRSKPYKDAPKGKNWRSVGYGFNDSGFWERYPEGISKHYENGITKAQAEKELDYFLGKAERQLKGIYGKRWNSFNDDQKAAILDTYYQRPASVGSKSGFYGAVMSGKDGAPYLGVQGFGDRNQSRRDLYRGRGVTAPVSFESIAESVPDTDVIHFEPLNPQAFGMQLPTYQSPVIDTIDTTDKAATIDKTYDPAAIEKQERQDNLRRFGMFMSMLDGTSGQDSGMPDFIDILAGKPMTYSKGGHLYDGTSEDSQQMRNGKYFATNSRGDSYYLSPSALSSNEVNVTVPETFVTANPDDVARGNAQRWWREHGNVYGEKGLEQVSPEFDLISLAPLVKPIVNTGLRSAGRMVSKVVKNHRYPLGRPQVPKDYITISPKTRTKIGDVEIDNPELTYRQGGKDMIEDFIDNGIVRGIDSRHIWGEAYANNPMFQHGSLFSKELSPGLLVSNGKTKAADVLSRPISEEAALKGGITFRIPDEPFTLANTQAYIFEPNYGYRRVLAEETPSLNWADVTRTPQITAENAASMTPEQWTAAQDAAIARGDMAKAQRLRDLHFKVNAPNTKIVDENGEPLRLYHGTKSKFNAFDESLYGSTDGGMYGTGVYTTPYKGYAEDYGDVVMNLYANISNPVDARNLSIDDLMLGKLEEGNNIFRWADIGGKRDGVLGKNHYLSTKYPYEVVSHKPSKVKSADAVTYDDNGVRIPLGKRDNFSINDIRYGLLPLGIGLTGYGFNE